MSNPKMCINSKKSNHFSIYPQWRAFGALCQSDLQLLISGVSTVGFEHCQFQVTVQTLLFLFIVSILIFNGVLNLYGKSYNHGSGHRSYALRDRRYLSRTAPKTRLTGGATAFLQWRTSDASREDLKLITQAKLDHFFGFK